MADARILPFAASTPPSGWLLCDGSAVSRATYAELFAAIGTTYGSGNGTTTFNLPDLRDRFALGKAASGTGSTLGTSGGSLNHTHAMTHGHSVTQPSAHAAHVVTQPGTHTSLSHTGFDADDHSSGLSHSGAAVSSHTVTDTADHGKHAAAGTHDHDSHSSGTNVSTGGSASGITAPTGQHSDDGSHDHDAHSAHNESVSAHSVTQPSAHSTQTHTVTQPSSHTGLTHAFTVSAHGAHTGMAVDDTEVTSAGGNPPYLALIFVIAPGDTAAPAGAILEHAGAALPSLHLVCDGSAVSRATYAELFAEIGTVFGAGNGTTTFNLPDLRGRHILGVGATALAATGGAASHTHAGASHGHTVTQANDHADHSVTQPSHAALDHSAAAITAHSMSHSGFSVGNHSVTQSGGHGTHSSEGSHNHDAHTITNSLATAGADVTVLTGPASLATEGGHTHDSHSAHSGAGLSAHVEAQPSTHSATHTVTQPNDHAAMSHASAALNSHSAHSAAAAASGTTATSGGADAPYLALTYLVKTETSPVPIGSLYRVGQAVAPGGTLLCQGQAVNRTTYADLFAAIGTAFGAGDGSTTFNVPDLRARIPRGANGDLAASGGALDHTHAVSSTHGHSATQPGAHSAHSATQPSAHGSLSHAGAAVATHSLSHTGLSVDPHTATQASSHSAHDASSNTNHDPHTTGSRTGGGGVSVRTTPVTHSFDGSHTHTGAHSHSGFGVNGHTETQPGSHSLPHAVTQPSSHSVSAHSGFAVDAHGAHSGFAVTAGGTGTTGAANPPYLVVNYVIQADEDVFSRSSSVSFELGVVDGFVVTGYEAQLGEVSTTPPSSPVIFLLDPPGT